MILQNIEKKKKPITTKRKKIPVKNFKALLLKEKVLSQKDIDKIEKETEKKVDKAVEFAENSPEPELKKFLEEVMS
jgi:TPP-dependent pyruvate/acetoin dehydrogenase alpha subunit